MFTLILFNEMDHGSLVVLLASNRVVAGGLLATSREECQDCIKP